MITLPLLLLALVPEGKPAAVIDLTTAEGVRLVRGEWRYSDVKIIEVDYLEPGADGQPGTTPNRTYDFTPHAGPAAFDDSKWPVIAPETLGKRRSTGRFCFNWYRIRFTVPERVGDFDPAGSTAVFETSLDDYAEVWVDGEISRTAGQIGGSVVGGFNVTNRLVVGRHLKPGQQIQLAVFGANGPLSNPTTNYIFMRLAKLSFYRTPPGPVSIPVSEVNVEVVRRDPAINAIVPINAKIHKLAEGFAGLGEVAWTGGALLAADAGGVRYRYTPQKGNDPGLLKPADEALPRAVTVSDQKGNVYTAAADGVSIVSAEGRPLGVVIAPKPPRHLAWGDDGKSLYFSAGTALYRMRLMVEGNVGRP